MIETVLLPFHGKIIYDGIVSTFNDMFGPGSRRGIEETFRTALPIASGMVGEVNRQVVGLADIKSARWILKYIHPKHNISRLG
jgi:hypothetical protein